MELLLLVVVVADIHLALTVLQEALVAAHVGKMELHTQEVLELQVKVLLAVIIFQLQIMVQAAVVVRVQ